MGLDAGGIRANVLLDLSKWDETVAQLKTKTAQVGDDLKKIPDAQPKLDTQPLEEGKKKSEGLLGELAQSIAKLTGGAVTLNTAQLEGAAAHASNLVAGITEDFVKLEAVSGLAGATIATVVVGAGVALLKMGQDFEAGFRQIAARTGETGHELEALRENVEQLAATGRGSVATFASEVAILHTRLGETGEELTRTAIGITDYAKATGENAVQATQELSRIFNLFHVSADETIASMDALVRVSQTTGTSQGVLRESLQASGAILKQYGLDIREATAFLGLLDQAGANSQQVAFGLRKALGDLSGPEAKEQLLDLLHNLGAASDQTLAHAVAVEIFGTRSATALLDLARSGKLSLEGLNAALEGADGASAKAAADMKSAADQMGVALEKAKQAWAPAAVAMAEAASQMAVDVIAKFNEIGEGIDKFLASDPVRRMATFLLDVKNFQPPNTTPEGPTPPPVVQQLNETPIPGQEQFDAAGTAVAGFAGRGLSQIGQKASEVAGAAGLGANSPAAQAAAAQAAAEQQLIETDKALQAANADVRVSFDDFIHGVVPAATATHEAAAAANAASAANEALIDTSLKATSGTLNFAAAIKQLAADQDAVKTILDLQQAWTTLDGAIKKITDTQIQAQLIQAQHNALLQTGAERLATLAAANAVATQEVDKETEAEKLAQKAKNDHLHMIEQLADLSQNSYAKALDTLASSILPNVTAAEAEHIKRLEISKDFTGLAAELARLYGVSQEELADKLAGSSANLAEFAKQGAAATKPLADFTSDEQKSRITGTLSSLEKGVDAGTAALAKQMTESGHANEAMELLLTTFGESPGKAQALVQALEAGGAAAAQAQAQISALTQYVESHGEMRLKVVVDIEQTQADIAKLQQSYQEQQSKFAETETKATATHVQNVQTIRDSLNAATVTFGQQTQAFNDALVASDAKMGEAIGKAQDAQNKAVSAIDKALTDAEAKHAQSVADAQTKMVQSFQDATEQWSKGMEGFAERARQIVQQAADAAAGALRQVSGAMQSFNDQQRAQANAASIAQQNATLQSYGFTDFQSQQSDLRLKEIQAQGTAALQQTGQANALNQTLQSANQALQKATERAADEMGKLDKSIENLNETYQKALDKAARDEAKTTRDADTALAQATRDAQDKRDAALAAERKATDQAFEQRDREQKALQDKQDQDTQKFYDEMRKHNLADPDSPENQEAKRFADEEKARHQAERDADKKYQEDFAKLQEKLADAIAKLPDAIAAKLHLGPETLDFKGSTFQETGVDYVGSLVSNFSTHIAGGGGG